MQPCLNLSQSWMLHPHERDKELVLSQFPGGKIAPMRNVGCEHTSYYSLQCSAWGHSCPHHSASLFTLTRVHCTLHFVSRTTHKCSQIRVSKDLFKVFKPIQEMQPDEDVWTQPTRFDSGLTASLAGQTVSMIAVSPYFPFFETRRVLIPSKTQN